MVNEIPAKCSTESKLLAVNKHPILFVCIKKVLEPWCVDEPLRLKWLQILYKRVDLIWPPVEAFNV
jgi:hypothetical protein